MDRLLGTYNSPDKDIRQICYEALCHKHMPTPQECQHLHVLVAAWHATEVWPYEAGRLQDNMKLVAVRYACC